MFDRLKIKMHPTQRELFAFAEGLEDEGSSVSVRLMRHVAGCKRCANEVSAIRVTLKSVSKAPQIEPSHGLSARILAAGRAERALQGKKQARFNAGVACIKSIVYAAGLLLVGFFSFRLALHESLPAPTIPSVKASPVQHMAMESPSPEELRKAASQLRVLALALDMRPGNTQNVMECRHRRMATALNDDLTAALAALERNPGNQQASRLVGSSIQRLADTQKRLYEERTL